MNQGLIWISEKELNEENKLISKIKSNINIGGIWGTGNFDAKPISFEEKEELLINWSGEEIKVEFFLTQKYAEAFVTYYHYLIYYDEWGVLKEKPIVFMQMESEEEKKKSKKPYGIKEILKFIKKEKKVIITIYFETTITKDPESKTYREINNLEIAYLGGLYDITDPTLVLRTKHSEKIAKTSKKKKWSYTNKSIEIKKYKTWNEIAEIAKETAETAEKMKKNKQKWEIFKYNYA